MQLRISLIYLLSWCCLLVLIPVFGSAQTVTLAFDEITVDLTANKVGTTEINALLSGRMLYLPVTELFDFLKINNRLSVDQDSLSGFFLNAGDAYVIDCLHHRAVVNHVTTSLKNNELIKNSGNLYLRTDLFIKLFGFACLFKLNNFSVSIASDLDFPVVRELRQEKLRENLELLRGNVLADSAIARNFPLFQTGMADWSVANTSGGQQQSSTRVYVRAGAVIAGGETTIAANYQTDYPFSEKQLVYTWRMVTNSSLIQQIALGKIYTNAIATLYAPVIGASVTNVPATIRQSYGTYSISNKTNPNWIVELYINNILINYIKTDATGIYRLDIPLQYGGSAIKLRFYGPLGEETVSEQFINIPFNFVPEGQLQYNATTGFTDETSHSRYSKIDLGYGISRHITVGGGTEYLSSITSGKTIPYINTSVSALSGLLFSAEYDYDVRAKAVIYYRLPSGMNIEFDDTRYHTGQTAINNDYTEEQQALIAFPFHLWKSFIFSSLSIKRSLTAVSGFNSINWQLSGSAGKLGNVSINTSASLTSGYNYVVSTVSLTKSIASIILRPAVQYNYKQKQLANAALTAERSINGNSYLSFAYNNYFGKTGGIFRIGFSRTFGLAQTSVNVQMQHQSLQVSETANGGFAATADGSYHNFNNHSNVGTSTVILQPFLDLNNNGRRDKNEPKVPGLKVSVKNGAVKENLKDTTVEVSNLQPYVSYNIKLDKNSLGVISWKIKNVIINVVLNANTIKIIDVPVSITGEVAGNVYLEDKKQTSVGHIKVFFYNATDKQAGSTLTENDGSFNFLGLVPGKYTASVDTAQLRKTNRVASPSAFSFSIKAVDEGDLVDNLEFILKTLQTATVMPVVNSSIAGSTSPDSLNSSKPIAEANKRPTEQHIIKKDKPINPKLNPVIKFDITKKHHNTAHKDPVVKPFNQVYHTSNRTKKIITLTAIRHSKPNKIDWTIDVWIWLTIWFAKR